MTLWTPADGLHELVVRQWGHMEEATGLALARGLRANVPLQSFTLEVQGIMPPNVDCALADAIRANVTLRSFTLTVKGMPYVELSYREAFKANVTLRHIECSSIHACGLEVSGVADVLRRNRELPLFA